MRPSSESPSTDATQPCRQSTVVFKVAWCSRLDLHRKFCCMQADNSEGLHVCQHNYQQFQAAIGPKVQGSRNLQHVLGDKLDFFVMLSSITSVVENRGQANYAAGNAYQDAFASHLVSRGIKAVSLNLRSIKTVGYVAENRERMQRQGVITTQWTSISEEDLHSIIEYQ